jgi:hypothetical protein
LLKLHDNVSSFAARLPLGERMRAMRYLICSLSTDYAAYNTSAKSALLSIRSTTTKAAARIIC